jgi:SAM-dependent methyltransferase
VDYESRIKNELRQFSEVEALTHADGVPQAAPYWVKSLNYIFEAAGINGVREFIDPLAELCRNKPNETIRVVSLGTGFCEHERGLANTLFSEGVSNFFIECLEINQDLCDRANASLREEGLSGHIRAVQQDINTWNPTETYDMVMAAWALHHFVELEHVFDVIKRQLSDEGIFVVSDVVGRNGHRRWPEIRPVLDSLWKVLPEKYKYNHSFQTQDSETYADFDCSTTGFEGIRAQDILPLLIERFHFKKFAAYAQVSELWIERGYGPNLSPDREEDRAFIDKLVALDEVLFDLGIVKPLRMSTVMCKNPVGKTLAYKNWTPEFCVRYPDGWIPTAERFNGTSVVMVADNDLAGTLAAMEAVLDNTTSPFRFVVVDNGSSENIASVLSQIPEGVDVIRNEQRIGSEMAWQQGIDKADGRHIAFIGNDIRVRSGWLDSLTTIVDGNNGLIASPVISTLTGDRRATNWLSQTQGVCLVGVLNAVRLGAATEAVLDAKTTVTIATTPQFAFQS